MATCPQCGNDYSDSAVVCPNCTPHPAQYGVEHDLRLVSVFSATDELTARLIHGALTSNGVLAYIHTEQVPMMGSILQLDHGCWGEVMVPEAYTDRAMDIIKAYTTENVETEAQAEEDSGWDNEDADEDTESPGTKRPSETNSGSSPTGEQGP